MAQVYYFSTNPTINESYLEKNKIKIYESKVATLKGYTLINKRKLNDVTMDETFLKEDFNNVTQGVCYLINEEDLNRVDKLEKYPTLRDKISVLVSFRGDKSDIPLKETYTYIGKQDLNDKSIQNYRIQKGVSRMKSESKILKFEPNRTGNNYMMTFEQYKESIEQNKLYEQYGYDFILESEQDDLFDKISKDVESQKNDKEKTTLDKFKEHFFKYKKFYIGGASLIAASAITYFILKSFKTGNFKDAGNVSDEYSKMADDHAREMAKYKKRMSDTKMRLEKDALAFDKKVDDVYDFLFAEANDRGDKKAWDDIKKSYDDILKARAERKK